MPPLHEMKLWLVEFTGLAKDALHIHVALLLFFGSALLFRWRLSDPRLWLIVLAAALAGEAWDIHDTVSFGGTLDPSANWHDIWNTLLWPTVIGLLARFSPRLKL
jgi:hypothetical protein